MTYLVGALLAIVALAFVLYPYYKYQLAHALQRQRPGDISGAAAQSSEREQSARTALQEVELDYQLGNITEEDYRSLRERHMRRAVVALKSRYDREQELDTVIETQLRRLREEEDG